MYGPAVHPARRFADLVAGDEDGLPLDEAALLIAAVAQPGLVVDEQLGRLDGLADACPEATLDGLCRYLFVDEGFTGNVADYGDPRNSYLDQVLSRRLGIPISLSVLAMEVGKRVGIGLVGVGMPGHFLVRDADDPDMFVDAFGGGRMLDRTGCEAVFRRLGGTGEFGAAHLAPVGPRAILSRMLANLQRAFLPGDLRSASWVLELRLAFPGLTADQRRALARALGKLGQFTAAAAELERLAEATLDEDAADLRAEAAALRARSN